MKSLARTTSPLGRPLDFTYRSNVIVVALSALTAAGFAAAEFVFGLSPASAWWAAGGSVFLAWAIAREIDPDRPTSAVAAMGIMAILAAAVQPPLLFAFGALTGLRLTAGTVGLAMKPSDNVAAIAIGGVLGLSDASLAAALLMAAGVIVIGGFRLPAIGVAVASLAAALGVSLATSTPVVWTTPDGLAVSLAAAATVALFLSVPASAPSVGCDVGDDVITGTRLTMARWLAWGGVLFAFVIYGGDGVLAAAPLVAASTGVALLRLVGQLRPARTRTRVGSLS